jgi:signal transduction histidine kinase
VPSTGAFGRPGGTIEELLPGSPAWRAGTRLGDRVLSIEPGPTAETWVMITERGILKVSGMIADLRKTLPMALVAVILALAALLALPLQPRVAAATAAVAVVLTERSMMATGDMAWSTTAAAAALVIPGSWFVLFGWRRASVGVLVAGVAVVATGLWLSARFMDPALFEGTEALRILVTYGLAVAIVALVIGRAVREAYGGYDVRRLSDVLLLAVVAAALAITLLLGVPPEGIILVIVVPILAFPLLRRGAHGTLERLILGDLRRRASVEAVERERERLAREIHDEPLQRLAAVARRLDAQPDMAVEADLVRSVTSELRDVAVQLHPPVLTDLGLAAALADLVDRLEGDTGMTFEASFDDAAAGGQAARAPADVELAAYRIVQEALTNAVRHSGAERIELRGRLRPDEIELVIHDDGVGLDRIATREATRRGHVGLHSMRERAELVGGTLRIERARPGTRVVFRWPS